MRRPVTAALIASGILSLTVASAQAGPCSSAVPAFEQDVLNSAKKADAGPTAPQSIGAQLHHQPNRDSVRRAEDAAQVALEEVLSRAKTLDAEGKHAEWHASALGGEAYVRSAMTIQWPAP
jgi:hypothetical protein